MNKKSSAGKVTGFIAITIICFLVFSLGLFPLIIFSKIFFLLIPMNQLWHLFLLPFFIYFIFVVTIFYQLLFSGLIIHLFKIKYEPGTYEYSYKNKMAFKWIVVCALYTPIRKILEIFPLGGIKNTYYRMLGMKIGENTLVGGVIKDPCLTEFGDNVTMGEYAIIYGHIHDYEKNIIYMDRVKIGNNCVIGTGAIIMPGAILEDDVKVAAGAVVTKSSVLKKGKMYGGIPAKEIKSKKKK
ncbi:MAG: DapH/DapD/GlmU-related protein [Candidatus Thermoplasmatota archaeon]|nr:DapH/DapD/GlmU-related protein [Candidatus Thermoplasmatota archaeon]